MHQVLIAASRLLNTLLGGLANETISARAYRDDWAAEIVINLMFRDQKHCMKAHQMAPRRPDGFMFDE